MRVEQCVLALDDMGPIQSFPRRVDDVLRAAVAAANAARMARARACASAVGA